ncbi:MAG: histidinol-phosphatase HisJ family protein [Ruminococcaceae bacterium]|nr:histidinol-phosphatase HisJ family protein [Oscillospiraceae bacterium]
MRKADFHVHTTYCDGASSPRGMVEAAVDKGLCAIGFSVHAYTYFDETYCIKKDRIPAYQKEIGALKKEYAGKIRIFCGVEQDVYSAEGTADFDYSIGSVHYVKKGGRFYPVDNDAATFEQVCRDAFGGDYYAFAESYFAAVGTVAAVVRPDIIGHFDLISKFNENGRYFDPLHPRYIAAWQAALEALLPAGIPFEVNTGAMYRGLRTAPYPAQDQLRYIASGGGRVILSGDAHEENGLCHAFDAVRELQTGVTLLSPEEFCENFK